ncbi:unnamed protein product [Porites evermanni]|uniref:Uncharacterized protein n=1 Tax=Porites evermanni TaxID=104178 RepID=A0ABN8L9T4_9CNID|nr:unnamed protein product [Porites evermanni]
MSFTTFSELIGIKETVKLLGLGENLRVELKRVKKAVPVLKGISDDQIKISYKDVQLGTFVNAFPCGSDSYRRVQLKVRESDSPFLLKSSRGSQPLPQETEHTKPNVAKLKLEQKTLFTPSDD